MLLAQKNARPGPEVINGATRLFSGLADLDYKPGYNNHTYFQYLSNNKNDISLLGAYYPEEIFDKYIIRVSGKGFTVVNHPSEVYGLPDAHECIDGNLPLCLVLDIDARQKPDPMNPELPSLDKYKITREDLLSRILIAYANIMYSDLKHLVPLNAFTLASLSNANKCSWYIVYSYARFIDYRDFRGFVEKIADKIEKPYSDLRLLGLAKEGRVKRPAISSVKEEYHELEDYLPIEDETTLSNGASLVIAKYEWLEIGKIGNGFIHFQAQLYEACPICEIKHEKDQLYGFLRMTEISAKSKREIVKKIGDAISNPHPLVGLLEMIINVEKLKDAPEVYSDFLGIEKMTILIRSPPETWKTTTLREIIMVLKNKVHDFSSLLCRIWVTYQKSLSNESKTKLDKLKASVQVESLFRIEFTARPFVAILDEANAIMRQMSSGTNAREFENAIRNVLRSARHVLAMDAFANTLTLTFLQTYHGENIRIVDNKYQPRIGETVEFIYDLNSKAEAMRIGYEFLRQGKRVAFVFTGAVMARALIEKASKLLKPDNSPVRARVYYGDMDGKQRQKDFSNINITWGELDCVAYTNTVEAGISFEITGHFNVVIAITNIATPVHVEAFAQMLYQIRDCPCRIISVFYQKNSNELFCSPGHENIRAELESARPNNLPTAIKGH
ncbi:33143_t:CDS:2 [Gigaspora margarita]|uniref:33143_t:CDS:1 n=1 Tax=Gigaspora margarita TaxID=4874 RepID=A0ABN7VZS8_GIGMA|nr:33143_t:CDS:2 [Gigaspora margarita]